MRLSNPVLTPWLLPITLIASGCSSFLREGTADLAGIGGAALASQVTDNAAVATGIGLGVRSAALAGLQYAQRKVHGEQQDMIARIAGNLEPGAVATWQVTHQIPIEENERGRVTVSRIISGRNLLCKEIVFSIDSTADQQPHSAFYVAIICRDANQWKWASAEPATERWGALQ
ncbi:MAG: hypothetical protein P9F19_08630 [Candidatus Contendobacter sp.]|nr:hypothetical protein [Candidatus Contendobacter sp.]MDG4557438.1 hypothetical protein [Candidatus Contendobacter sp.]